MARLGLAAGGGAGGGGILLVDGVLQNQEGVTSIKAERLHGLGGVKLDFESHDFH